MKITGGMWRGIPLNTPSTDEIRPTSDKARQAVFNTLLSGRFDLDLNSARVLDGTAGTGAMGIEALSRGASFCYFTDPFKSAQILIKRNLEKTKADKSTYQIHPLTVQMLPRTQTSCDLIFLDPPYGRNMLPDMVHRLIGNGWADQKTLFVMEEDSRITLSLPLETLDRKSYGKAQIIYARMPA